MLGILAAAATVALLSFDDVIPDAVDRMMRQVARSVATVAGS